MPRGKHVQYKLDPDTPPPLWWTCGPMLILELSCGLMQQTLKISSHANDIFSEKVLLSKLMPTHMWGKLKWHGSVVEGLGAKLACMQPWLATVETLNSSAAENLQKGKNGLHSIFRIAIGVFTVQMLVVNRRDDATNPIETYCFTICCFLYFQIIRHLKFVYVSIYIEHIFGAFWK